MQYSPKLKGAMEEIKSILKKHDLAAVVVLHTPGFSEYLHKLDPTYSCARIENQNVRFKASLQNNFKGDKKAMEQTLADTSNMMHCLSTCIGNIAMNMLEASNMLDKQLQSNHFGGGHTSNEEQNN